MFSSLSSSHPNQYLRRRRDYMFLIPLILPFGQCMAIDNFCLGSWHRLHSCGAMLFVIAALASCWDLETGSWADPSNLTEKTKSNHGTALGCIGVSRSERTPWHCTVTVVQSWAHGSMATLVPRTKGFLFARRLRISRLDWYRTAQCFKSTAEDCVVTFLKTHFSFCSSLFMHLSKWHYTPHAR